MLDSELPARRRSAPEVRAFDPEGLGIFLGRFSTDGSVQLRTLLVTAAACAAALGTISVRSPAIVDGTVHSVGRTHPIVSPATGSLFWSGELRWSARPSGERIDSGSVEPRTADLPVANVRRGQRIAAVIGAEAEVIVVQTEAAVPADLPLGSRAVIHVVSDSRQRGAEGRVSAVEAGVAPTPEQATTVHIVVDGDTRMRGASTPSPKAALDPGQRVTLQLDSGRRSLWSLMMRGAGARADAAPAMAWRTDPSAGG